MARSLGDSVAAEVGVSGEPGKIHSEIIEVELQSEDKFIIIASDGLWEFLSNEYCVKIVSEYWEAGNPEGACDRLLKESVAMWRREDDVIDDITVVIIFLSMLAG